MVDKKRFEGRTYTATDDGLWDGYVDEATLMGAAPNRTLRIIRAEIDDAPFEAVLTEDPQRIDRFIGEWRYPKRGNGPVELRLYVAGDSDIALIGNYTEEGEKGEWVFELSPIEDDA